MARQVLNSKHLSSDFTDISCDSLFETFVNLSCGSCVSTFYDKKETLIQNGILLDFVSESSHVQA